MISGKKEGADRCVMSVMLSPVRGHDDQLRPAGSATKPEPEPPLPLPEHDQLRAVLTGAGGQVLADQERGERDPRVNLRPVGLTEP